MSKSKIFKVESCDYVIKYNQKFPTRFCLFQVFRPMLRLHVLQWLLSKRQAWLTYVKRKPKRVKNTLPSKNSKFSSQVNRSFCISWSRDQLSINRKTFRFWNGEGRRSKQRNEFAEWHVVWLEFPADSKLNLTQTLNLLSFSWLKNSLKFNPITRILVLVTPLRCHTISSSCCIMVKTLKKKIIRLQQFDFNWCNEQIRFYH